MVTAVWSTKGGTGVSTVAALLGLARAAAAHDTLLVDLDGDLPALLGLADGPTDHGVAEWSATDQRSVTALTRITQEVAPDLRLLRRGVGPLYEPGDLVAALGAGAARAVIDCGVAATGSFAHRVLDSAGERLLVVRACYLALRSTRQLDVAPTGVVFVRERGRALGLADIERVVAAPVVAEIAVDPAIARTIDAGLAVSRLPRGLLRALAGVDARAA